MEADYRPERYTLVLPRPVEPFQVGALVLCLIYGIGSSAFFSLLGTQSLRAYPLGGGRLFAALLAVGAATALLGLLMPNLGGLHVERAGLFLLTGLGLAYTIWTPFVLGWRGLPLLLFLGVLVAVPSGMVARRRGRLIAQAERAGRARPEEEAPSGRQ